MAKQTRLKSIDLNINQQAPVRITIELDIVVHVRKEQHSGAKANFLLAEEALGGSDCPEDKFTYSFETDNAKVLSLTVEGFKKDNPGNSGDFTTCIADANRFRVMVFANELNPGGRAALTLKYLGKDVFSSPKELELGENSFLILNTLAKLPL
ncbi:MAG: hypothetical protein IPO85_18670 [Saprospiraceae bacterium]|uniref:Uncharacterized protein n=1 Tax=Candidatus Defluviibacterium haderslevense TaxID=2981993 RepID=A0A9D7SD87_9BACT|nr:hypothetical protein [Candidatus Defluviibacterium haderslevense]